MSKQWRCEVCGYIHTGEGPPAICPKCGVGPECFYELDRAKPEVGGCPDCGSDNLEKYKYNKTECFKCKDCGFDICEEFEQTPEERTSQKEKGRYSPYKTGGGKRSQ